MGFANYLPPLFSPTCGIHGPAVVFAGCRLSLGLSVGFLLSVLAVFLSGFERFFFVYLSSNSGFLEVLIFRCWSFWMIFYLKSSCLPSGNRYFRGHVISFLRF